MHLELAKLILAAVKAYEDSYDQKAAHKAIQLQQKQMEADPSGNRVSIIDFKKFYGLSLYQACEQVCPPEMMLVVYLLLVNSWNDAILWAECTISNYEEEK